MDRRISLLSLGFLGAFGACSVAADWPQWRGPRHDGTTTETGLLKQWPAEGPRMLWKNDTIGGGYSTPSVVGKHVYLLGDKDNGEHLIVLDAATGKEVLRSKVGPLGKDGPPSYPGPRSTPTIDGEAIYVLGSAGDLVCFSLNGDVKWKKNLKTDFAGKVGQWAYAESPLVDGGVVVCTPGGEKSSLVALDKKTGATIWESAVPGGDAAGYASVLPIEVGGVRQYVQFLAKGLVGVDAKTGKFLWRYAGTIDQAANIPTPVFHDNCVFTSTSRKGSGLNRIQVKDGAVSSEEVYFNNTKINSIGGVVLVGDYVYGANDKGELVCMDFKTGDVKWHKRSRRGRRLLCRRHALCPRPRRQRLRSGDSCQGRAGGAFSRGLQGARPFRATQPRRPPCLASPGGRQRLPVPPRSGRRLLLRCPGREVTRRQHLHQAAALHPTIDSPTHNRQFSTCSPGTALKSLSAETTVQLPNAFAIAAIIMSMTPMGRPRRVSSAQMRPYSKAAAASKAQSFRVGNADFRLFMFRSRLLLFSMPATSSASTGMARPMAFPFATSMRARSKTPRRFCT